MAARRSGAAPRWTGGAAVEVVLLDAAAIALAWGVLLLAENVVLAFLWREQFSGAWEVTLARHTVLPAAFAGLAPLAVVVAAGWSVAGRAQRGGRWASWSLAVVGGAAVGALAFGVSGGRHFASWTLRAPFVLAWAAAGAFFAARLLPRVTAWPAHPLLRASFGLLVAAAAWLADSCLLPRLYPAFHWGMLAATLLGAALLGLAFRGGASRSWPARAAALAALVLEGACLAQSPGGLRDLDRATNLRVALVEHGPVLGAAVVLATRLRPPPDAVLGDANSSAGDAALAEGNAPVAPAGENPRSLDWAGRDIVLLTVDALRADHVTSYGYARRTTPSIDSLAGEGTLFESAYCPTPQTSYSLSSLLTGKYLRPLLALGLGEDSETWAQALRRYGWKTAAFYPPAVFFIDEARFVRFEREHFGFEYAKVEFADPVLREAQVSQYLEGVSPEASLFLWVHFFEPHEPYIVHPGHVFTGGPSADLDAYDSEVATADEGIGRIVRLVRQRRPGAVFLVTADHGEEFGEHGGRYHGTSVYEEQVRVPLVVAGPGVRRGARVASVVQTIDLLPTVLSALAIPRPARVRGRDLGVLLSGRAAETDPGFAFAEAEDYSLVAAGDDRLVCERRAAACVLYRPAQDPRERRDVASDNAERFDALRSMLRRLELDHGRYESAAGPSWPEALRRGMQGEADAALDVAALLDDAETTIRRKAAEVCYELRAPATVPAVRRALAREEDEEARRWLALAATRLGLPPPPLLEALLKDEHADWRRRAALVLGERGDGRGCDEIAAWWSEVAPATERRDSDGEPPRLSLELTQCQELLQASSRARCRSAVPSLLRALRDVRARPYVADTLGALGDDRARVDLLAAFADEPYVTARPHEARALLALGVHDYAAPFPSPDVDAVLARPRGATRLLVLVSDPAASLEGRLDGAPLPAGEPGAEVRSFELSESVAPRLRVALHASTGGIVAAWLVRGGRLD